MYGERLLSNRKQSFSTPPPHTHTFLHIPSLPHQYQYRGNNERVVVAPLIATIEKWVSAFFDFLQSTRASPVTRHPTHTFSDWIFPSYTFSTPTSRRAFEHVCGLWQNRQHALEISKSLNKILLKKYIKCRKSLKHSTRQHVL